VIAVRIARVARRAVRIQPTALDEFRNRLVPRPMNENAIFSHDSLVRHRQ